MIPGEISEPLPVQRLEHISPSRYGYLSSCSLRELWLGASHPALLPRSPAAILGTLAHQVLATASQVSCSPDSIAILSLWNEIATNIDSRLANSWLERSLYPLSRSARSYEVVRLRVLERVARIAASRGRAVATPRPGFGFEVGVRSREGLIRGRIDWVYGAHNGPVIADFKSGHILENPSAAVAEVKPEHKLQLWLYAGLYSATYGKWPVRLGVVPLNGERVAVPFDPSACEKLAFEATRALRILNDKVDSLLASGHLEAAQRLANPEATLCRVCLYRPACPAYQQAIPCPLPDAWPSDVVGVVTEIVRLRHDRVNVVLRLRSGDSFTMRAVSDSERHPTVTRLGLGDRLGVFNFNGPKGRNDASEGRTTTLYRIGGQLGLA